MFDPKLTGKVAIVTGASSGIGQAVARRLALSGVKVVLAARREDRLQSLASEIRAAGGSVLAVPSDVRQRADIERLFGLTLEHWGQLDILFNSAGVSYDQPLIKMDPERLREEVEVNLLSVIACSQAALKPMLKVRAGHIVNVASIAGLIGLPGSSVYNATKFGVIGFSEGLGREVSRFGVRVSAFCPGFVATELSPRLKNIRERLSSAQSLPGVMDVEYVAERALWLIQHPRRRYLIPHLWTVMIWAGRTFPWGADWVVSRFRKQFGSF
jgi:short-subunit dehydrogenase